MTHFPIQDFSKLSTPFYYYDIDCLLKTLQVIEDETKMM